MKYLIHLMVVLITAQLSAETMPALSLAEACSVALEHNLSIQQAHNTARIAHNNAAPGNAGLLPRVDLSSGTTITDADLQTPAGSVSSQNTRNTAGVTASYTLFRGFQGLTAINC